MMQLPCKTPVLGMNALGNEILNNTESDLNLKLGTSNIVLVVFNELDSMTRDPIAQV